MRELSWAVSCPVFGCKLCPSFFMPPSPCPWLLPHTFSLSLSASHACVQAEADAKKAALDREVELSRVEGRLRDKEVECEALAAQLARAGACVCPHFLCAVCVLGEGGREGTGGRLREAGCEAWQGQLACAGEGGRPRGSCF